MKEQDYQVSLTVPNTPADVFKKINDVAAWWTDDLKGSSEKLGDSFTVQFDSMHISTQKIIESVPDKKIVWLVTESNLSFIKQKDEWTNTRIHFEIVTDGNTTILHFTHTGLVPQIECYKDCTNGWDYFIKGSLYQFLTEGKGTPGL